MLALEGVSSKWVEFEIPRMPFLKSVFFLQMKAAMLYSLDTLIMPCRQRFPFVQDDIHLLYDRQ